MVSLFASISNINEADDDFNERKKRELANVSDQIQTAIKRQQNPKNCLTSKYA